MPAGMSFPSASFCSIISGSSEVIGASKLRENSVAQLAKSLIDTLKPSRKEDEKVAEIRKATQLLSRTLRDLGDE